MLGLAIDQCFEGTMIGAALEHENAVVANQVVGVDHATALGANAALVRKKRIFALPRGFTSGLYLRRCGQIEFRDKSALTFRSFQTERVKSGELYS